MAAEREKLLDVQDLTVRFGSKRRPFTAVDRVSFHIFKGETFGLVGESGSGKTTIGRAIIRIHPAAGGKVVFDGRQINGRIPRELDREVTRRIQMIFQDPYGLPQSTQGQGGLHRVRGPVLHMAVHLSKAERDERVAQALNDGGAAAGVRQPLPP